MSKIKGSSKGKSTNMNILTKIEELYEEGTRTREERRKPFPDPKLPNFFDALDGCTDSGDDSEKGKGTEATVPGIQKEGV
jgi:hypothetical protein